MTAANPNRNYFALFDLPETFNVDPANLADRYRHLQQAVHPDRFASGTDQERRLSMQQSALINEAYQTLKQPLARARYLLSLHGIDMAAEERKPMDGAFLMQQMELRESLEAVKTVDQLLEFESRLKQLTNTLSRDIGQMFAGEVEEKLDMISDHVRRMQFLIKLEEEVQSLEEQLQ